MYIYIYTYTDVAGNAGAFTKFVSHLAFVLTSGSTHRV
jgi:hypothetical protein